jgi:predicted TIM-barrel fold metal-dependent hydrolase
VQLTDGFPPGVALDAKEGLPGGVYRFTDAPKRLYEFIYSGVMRRFPRLELLFAETDAGWVPCWKEQAFNRWRRQSPALREAVGMVQSPLDYMDRIHYTYITDTFAIRNRDAVGVEQMLWSSDFPHSEGDYPNSWRTIHSDFASVSARERRLILVENTLRVFRITG